MIEVTAEPDTGIIDHGLYNHHGALMLAVNGYLVPVMEDGNTKHTFSEASELVSRPGDKLWCDRMIQFRQTPARDLRIERNLTREMETRYENLGQALLEEAEQRDWCEEYDTFAEQWGLPPMSREWDVTITVRMMGRNEEQVEERISLNTESEHTVDYPEINITRCQR